MVHLSATFATAAAALVALLPAVSAEAPAGTVKYTWEKRYVNKNDLGTAEGVRRMMRKRQNVVNAQIDNQLLLYVINVTVGSTQQPLSLVLDTGSSDIWFPATDASACQRSPELCSYYGSFDRTESTSFSAIQDYPEFEISYVDGTEIQGQYFTDVLNIGGTSVTDMTMAYAETFTRPIGIMGIGFQAGESSNFGSSPFTYPNIIDQLKAQGHINTLSYSLWLDDPDAQTGSILFGGVDKAKYTGSLVTLPIQIDSTTRSYSSLSVAWTGLRLTGNNNNIDYSPSAPEAAILDSGTSITYLPDNIVSPLYKGLGVLSQSGFNLLPCNLRNDNINLEFEFGGSGGAKIVISIRELLFDLLDSRTNQPLTYQGTQLCDFGIASTGSAGNFPVLFGDTFLRSAYVVYDLENRQIGLAQTNFNANSGTQDVEAFSSGAGIPDSTSTADAVSVGQTFTGRPPVGSTTANANDNEINGGLPKATISLSPTGNAAPHAVPVETSILPFLGVMVGAFVFGGMLI